MRRADDRGLYTLDIPLEDLSLLMPGAAIAEIINAVPLAPVPGAPSWLLGVVAWRTLVVPIVSFEALISGRAPAPFESTGKIVMLYPLNGRDASEFIGIVATSEPRPRSVTAADALPAAASEIPATPYLAGGIKVSGRVLAIPNLDALKKAFYPA